MTSSIDDNEISRLRELLLEKDVLLEEKRRRAIQHVEDMKTLLMRLDQAREEIRQLQNRQNFLDDRIRHLTAKTVSVPFKGNVT